MASSSRGAALEASDDDEDDFDAASAVRLRVRKMSGDSDEIEAKESWTVGDAKLAVQAQQENIEPFPKWMINDRILDDDEIIRDLRSLDDADKDIDGIGIQVSAIAVPRKFQSCWEVQCRKLMPHNGPVVSPDYTVTPSKFSPPITYRISISPQLGGRGSIKLRFLKVNGATGGSALVWITIGTGPRRNPSRGPIEVHNVAQGIVCELPAENAQWKFREAMDPDLGIVCVSAEIMFLSDMSPT